MYRRLPNGEIQFLLTDFGIAKLREQTDGITVTGGSMLTYDYASPEQFNQSKTVSTPTDYYSLGIVLYECLTGTVPFEYEQDDLLTHINRVIAYPPPMPRMPGGLPLPPSMLQLLQGLLAKQSINRLSDPVKVRHLLRLATIEDLRGIHTPQAGSAQQTMAYQAPAPTATAKRRDYTFSTLLLLVIGVVIFFSWTTWVRSNEPAPMPLTPKDNKAAEVLPVKYAPHRGLKSSEVMPIRYDDQEAGNIAAPPLTGLANPIAPAPEEPGTNLTNGMYYHDFSDAEDSAWDVGRDENSEYKIEQGKYIMKGLNDSLSYSSAIKLNFDTNWDFTVAANITHLAGSSDDPYGLNFCGDKEQDSYLIFYINANGYYSIGSMVKGEWNVLTDWTASSHIRPDNEVNTMVVEKQGDALRFYINDKLEKTMPFPGGYGHHFGMRVDGAQTVSFDQFIVKGTQ